MTWGRKLVLGAGAMALAGLSASAVMAGVIVKSSGPSASKYPVGKKLDDADSITLADGDKVTVLTDAGTRVLSGPGTHRVGAKGASKRTTFAMLTRQGAGGKVRTGAVRGTGDAAAPANPNLWNIDASTTGRMCLPQGGTVSFWRPQTTGEESWMLGSEASDFHVHVTFAEGSATASLEADELPLDSATTYELTGPGGAVRRIELVPLAEVPSDAEGLAMALVEHGCAGQLDQMSERLAS